MTCENPVHYLCVHAKKETALFPGDYLPQGRNDPQGNLISCFDFYILFLYKFFKNKVDCKFQETKASKYNLELFLSFQKRLF